ncbi:MAG: hypothetical protein JST54_18340 [Deltaproteobacteria bacterium]|nr:hypothetical protein [Deltaproteobacteria bacterium]
MVRRLALLCLPLSALAILGSLACGGTKNFTFDAGPLDAGPVDAGPCDPYAQTNCPTGLKCTIQPAGNTICGAAGTGDVYTACNDDSNCKAGTACVDLEFSGFVAGKHCFPFCDLSLQPTDGGTTCPQASSGSSCLNLTTIPEGFCDLPLDAGP